MLLLAACGAPPASSPSTGSHAPAAPSTRPDIVLVLIPGLGADLGGRQGAERAFLSPFGAPSVRFTAAYAQSPAPFVSLGSLLTGLYATAAPLCGLYDDGTHPLDTTERAWCATIPPSRHTLPEVLGLYGYRTALFTSGLHGADALATSFQTHVELSPLWAHRETPWEDLHTTLSAWWSVDDAPRFTVLVLPELMPTCRPALLADMGMQPGVLDGRGDPAQAFAAYDAESGRTGAHLAELLHALPAGHPRWVVLSSTNGLSISADTGLMGGNRVPAMSNNFVLERTVHVPLAMYGPETPTAPSVGQVVEILDLFPTLAHVAGAVPPAGLPGEDLLAIGTPDPKAWAYAEFGEFLAVRRGPLLLSFRSYQHHPAALDPQLTEQLLSARDVPHFFRLHDVTVDPLQTTDVAADVTEMRTLLTTLRTGLAAPPPESIDPRKLWELRMSPSQGYW